ncbi:ABC transporter permease [Streptomyces sp. VRA16 Mangrove soil]|uniref:ABC transporter permease n=1 Tax=Streptomyces sp. VRA16 Mangrove soil TaxID=2817434 RepID=UPI001A9E0581|nr:ABC transporter permease [Streptomyces sp. VRA16 Mangrove soil]MBO1337184.1 ABC transporter permease [Streptomyces sp. VRA16 Mangrove soil]
MLTATLRSLRARWTTLAGTFVALLLGAAAVAATGFALDAVGDAPERVPQRFAAAPVVVRGAGELRVGADVRTLPRPRPLSPSLVRELRTLGRVVEDRSFDVWAGDGAGELVGHPWSVAALGRYAVGNGRAPRADDEVVVPAGTARPGQRLVTSRGTVRVVGVTARASFERALFFTDRRAAQLEPEVTQLAVVGATPGAVRDAVRDRPGVRVLTGDDRRLADPDPGRDQEAATALTALFGTAAGVTGFVSVFVVASTFAFAVDRRRREFGLLRLAGATPGQVRRSVLAEALLVGALASAAGCALGGRAAPYLGRWTVAQGLAPQWFTIRADAAGPTAWPYQLAFWSGLFVALCGVVVSSWRAGRTRPGQALREATVDGRTLTSMPWRLLAGGVLLATALVTLVLALASDPGDLLHRKTYTTRPMLLIAAAALLAPVLVRPLLRAAAWLPARLPGATGLLVRENATAAARRTAAVAAPVLATVALAGSLLGATGTIAGAKAAEARQRTLADYVVTPPAGSGGLDADTVRRLRRVPGATVSATAATTLYVPEDGGVALVKSEARAAEPGPLRRTVRLPVVAGRLGDLDDGSVVVTEEWQRHTVGDRVTVHLADGTRRTLRIAAVLRTGTGDNGAYVTPRNGGGASVDRVDVRFAGEASVVRAAVAGTGARVVSGAAWLDATRPGVQRATRLGLLLVLGIALLYTGIAVANVAVMATADRGRDLAALRLAGATRGQVLGFVAAEALAVAVSGGVLGVLVAGANLLGMRLALSRLGVAAPVVVPWSALGVAVGVCAAVAVGAAVGAARVGGGSRAVRVP